MRTYQVWLRGMSKFIELEAADVELVTSSEIAYWNFWLTNPEGAEVNVTVAAFPFNEVAYIVSVK